MLRKLVHKLPPGFRTKVHNRLLGWATKVVSWQTKVSERMMDEETKDLKNVLVISKSTPNQLFARFDSMTDEDKIAFLATEFGWEIPQDAVEKWRLTALNDISGSSFDYRIFGYIAFKRKADLMLWKLTYEYQD